MGTWIANSDAALEASGPEAVRAAYVEQDFADYYSSDPAGAVRRRSHLQQHPGVDHRVRHRHPRVRRARRGSWCSTAPTSAWPPGCSTPSGAWDRFWGLILPHGLLELTAVDHRRRRRAAARVGAASIPATATRAAALAEEGRRSVIVVLGLDRHVRRRRPDRGVRPDRVASCPPACRVGIGVLVRGGLRRPTWCGSARPGRAAATAARRRRTGYDADRPPSSPA